MNRPITIASALAVTLALGAVIVTSYLFDPPPRPVLTVATPYPTAHKPQSKLWVAHGHWWAWLPDGDGSSIWRRSERGWQRQAALDAWLRALPGRADVWSQGGQVRAVLVSAHQLATASLVYRPERDTYEPHGAPVIWTLPPREDTAGPARSSRPGDDAWWNDYERGEPVVESATIARDGSGIWWIVYDFRRAVWARYSLDVDGAQWSDPVAVGGPISPDDISVALATTDAIGAMWGRQSGGDEVGIYFRRHRNGRPGEDWEPVEVVARGPQTAEDHFNAAVGPAGRVYVATKDNADVIGHGQLVLRVREPGGGWRNLPYAKRTTAVMPTRPIVLLGESPPRLYLVHSLYPRKPASSGHHVAYRTADPALLDLDGTDTVLIPPRRNTDIRNATSTRQTLSAGPWIVLASDEFGNVYEGRIEVKGR